MVDVLLFLLEKYEESVWIQRSPVLHKAFRRRMCQQVCGRSMKSDCLTVGPFVGREAVSGAQVVARRLFKGTVCSAHKAPSLFPDGVKGYGVVKFKVGETVLQVHVIHLVLKRCD